MGGWADGYRQIVVDCCNITGLLDETDRVTYIGTVEFYYHVNYNAQETAWEYSSMQEKPDSVI
jgi:hypothetical protein